MPATSDLLAFALISLGMVLTPGPNMIYLVSRSICQGRRAGLVSLGGVVLGTALGRLDVPVHRTLTWAAVYAQLVLLGWGLGTAEQRRLAGLRERLAARERAAEPVR